MRDSPPDVNPLPPPFDSTQTPALVTHDWPVHGAAVVINSRSKSEDGDTLCAEISKQGGRAIYIVADVAREEEVERMVNSAVAEFGRVDILVNNAAVRRLAPLEKLSLAEWREVMAVILDGAFTTGQTIHVNGGLYFP